MTGPGRCLEGVGCSRIGPRHRISIDPMPRLTVSIFSAIAEYGPFGDSSTAALRMAPEAIFKSLILNRLHVQFERVAGASAAWSWQ